MAGKNTPELTHVDEQGNVRMVDVSEKSDTVRTAVAEGRVLVGPEAFRRIKEDDIRKGNVLAVAQIAGIQGAKETSRLIPLCHGLNLAGVEVELELDEEETAVRVRTIAKTAGPTGVEMEALAAASIAALTVYDMCKSVTKDIEITDIRLLAKTGGQSGNYRRHSS